MNQVPPHCSHDGVVDGASAAVLETERLVLRRLGEDDAAFMLDLLNQPSFIRNIGDRGVRSLDAAAGYIRDRMVASYERHGFGLYGVVVKASGELAGICGLVKREGLADVDVGFAFLPQYWSKGYAVEAARATRSHAAALGLTRLVAITSPSNVRSIRVLEKVGFTFDKELQLPPGGETLKLFVLDRV
jgi:RimJ/RimL family protein N-acetyltransferase